LLRANLGHSQVQHLTVLGHPVSVAAALCDAAPRDRSVVLAAEETAGPIRDALTVSATEGPISAKAARFTAGAYEVGGLRAG
jgi:class 3 adenylate cyclase